MITLGDAACADPARRRPLQTSGVGRSGVFGSYFSVVGVNILDPLEQVDAYVGRLRL
jgi:hypothetical protein